MMPSIIKSQNRRAVNLAVSADTAKQRLVRCDFTQLNI